MTLATNVEKIPTTTTRIQNENDIKTVLPSLLSTFIPPLTVHRVSGGITNQILRVSHRGSRPSSVLVRIFGGEGVFTDAQRERENQVFAQLAQEGISPALHAIFGNGRVEQYINARPLELHEMTGDITCIGVATAMARMHSFHVRGESTEPRLWLDIHNWAKEALRLEKKSCITPKYSATCCIKWLHDIRSTLDQLNSPVIYSHNDLHCRNILISPDNQISIIDFEYSSFNFRGFDIANFFCEAMGGTIDGNVFPEKYPTLQFRSTFCEIYLRECGTDANREAVSRLLCEAEKFELAAHLYWGLWALVQNGNSTLDFPYGKFAENRFTEFVKKFNHLMGTGCTIVSTK